MAHTFTSTYHQIRIMKNYIVKVVGFLDINATSLRIMLQRNYICYPIRIRSYEFFAMQRYNIFLNIPNIY